MASMSPEVERTILRCLRKDPARRYQTMADLKVALDDLAADSAEGQQSLRRRPGAASRRWRWAWIAIIPIVLAAGYFVWQSLRSPESMPPHSEPFH